MYPGPGGVGIGWGIEEPSPPRKRREGLGKEEGWTGREETRKRPACLTKAEPGTRQLQPGSCKEMSTHVAALLLVD